MADEWIFPNPHYPGKIGRSILVDLDSREPLRDDQVDALYRALDAAAADREKFNEAIRKFTRRILLSGERQETDEHQGN